MGLGMAFTMSAQTWQRNWQSADEMKGTMGQYTWYWESRNGSFMYWEKDEWCAFLCSEGVFDYTLYDGEKWVDVRIGFYEGSSLSYQTTYRDCGVGASGDTVGLVAEETRPIWAWLSKGRNYSVRFIVERYNRSDFDFVVKGK